MKTIDSLPSLTAALREIMAAPETQLQGLAGEHEHYEGSRFCVEDMWHCLATKPEILPRFAATVLKSRQDPAFGEIELINTGE